MKDFLKYTLATIVGIIASLLILTVVSTISLFGLLSSTGGTTTVADNSLFVLDLDGTLAERSQDSPMDYLIGQVYGDSQTTYGLDDILEAIDKAAETPGISGIYLQAGSLDAQPASLEAIRHALLRFKESGKFIIAYADNYEQPLYYLASVADKVILNPKGMLDLHGLAGQVMLYKDLMDKLGIEMEVFKVGTFKSAVEPYMLNKISDANSEQMSAYIGAIWKQWTKDIAESRGLTAGRINELADSGLTFQEAEATVGCGLVDTLMYKNDVRGYLKERLGKDKDDNLSLYGIDEMLSVASSTPRNKNGNIIAVYYATGEIDGSNSLSGASDGINSSEVIRDLRRLQEDDDVRAVVLRVNSPGGSAQGSEQIWHALSQLKKEKPLIVSMGDYAASGGYYISCVADSIIAEPTTLTGSIGIFGIMPNVSKLADKVGVHVDVVKTNTYADTGTMFRPMTEGEKALMQRYVEQGYDLFLTRVSDGRRIAKDSLDHIAQGRVWTGEMALERGLVDKLGGLDDAIDMAKRMSKTDECTVMSYPAKESMFSMLMGGDLGPYIKQRITGSSLKGDAAKIYSDMESVSRIGSLDRLQARLPYDVRIR